MEQLAPLKEVLTVVVVVASSSNSSSSPDENTKLNIFLTKSDSSSETLENVDMCCWTVGLTINSQQAKPIGH